MIRPDNMSVYEETLKPSIKFLAPHIKSTIAFGFYSYGSVLERPSEPIYSVQSGDETVLAPDTCKC